MTNVYFGCVISESSCYDRTRHIPDNRARCDDENFMTYHTKVNTDTGDEPFKITTFKTQLLKQKFSDLPSSQTWDHYYYFVICKSLDSSAAFFKAHIKLENETWKIETKEFCTAVKWQFLHTDPNVSKTVRKQFFEMFFYKNWILSYFLTERCNRA